MYWLIIILKLLTVIGYVSFMANLLKTNFSKLIQSKNDTTVPSISRFQILFWTGLYGFVFLYHFISSDELLKFSQNDLLLIGISGGVYLGGKWVGNQTGRGKEGVDRIAELKKEIDRINEEISNTKVEQSGNK
ncbi:hypothetical protein BIV60_07880 [Bacillus sp. MUM 116]|uniref:hypothetical protein n=1 Tax=Bacillus sp. MUM 116 TaxID=1678002 RepID=UPI0008F56198|nr:hypothetical protein [Bacillus sp. MUM 116]OIK15879.1 hypothetical protein BIV60_07880 [Bacillus sp. MUM 116]